MRWRYKRIKKGLEFCFILGYLNKAKYFKQISRTEKGKKITDIISD